MLFLLAQDHSQLREPTVPQAGTFLAESIMAIAAVANKPSVRASAMPGAHESNWNRCNFRHNAGVSPTAIPPRSLIKKYHARVQYAALHNFD
jgi:hypothetical protein